MQGRRYWISLIFVASTWVFTSKAYGFDFDPTVPLEFDKEDSEIADEFMTNEESPIVLNAIVMNKDRRIAVVNGEIVREGDMIAGHHVVKIFPDTVTFSKGDDVTELKMPNVAVSVKQP